MTPLINSTPHQDLRDWRELDKRVRTFKESQWQKNFNFNPLIAFVFTCLVGAMFAIALLFLTSLIVVK